MTRVAVAWNDDRSLAHGEAKDAVAVADVIASAAAVIAACRTRGWDTVEVPLAGASWECGRTLLRQLDALEPDVVFNLVESVAGQARLESAVAGILELWGGPYTGSGPVAMTLALDKAIARAVLRDAGVPIARGVAMTTGDEPLGELEPPWIVKPSREDASHGIALESVTSDETALRRRARWVVATYRQPALVEEFMGGREINVGLLARSGEMEVLPLSEIDYSGFPAGAPHLITHAAKWEEESAECRGSVPVPAELEPVLLARTIGAAQAARCAIGVRDYARVDLRIDPVRGPVVLEVNPNPDLSPGAGLARSAARAGITHDEMVARIVEEALARV